MEQKRLTWCAILLFIAVCCVTGSSYYSAYSINRLEKGIENTYKYVRETTDNRFTSIAVCDFQIRIAEQQKQRLKEKRWLKVSDIEAAFGETSSGYFYFIEQKNWDKLINEKSFESKDIILSGDGICLP